jgi:hypothetical protein
MVLAMTDLDNLDALSSRQLHDLAVRRALRHLDVAFLWQLLREIPAGEAAAGHPDAGSWDAIKVSSLITDAFESGDSELADSLRPLYLDYLNKHRADLHHD